MGLTIVRAPPTTVASEPSTPLANFSSRLPGTIQSGQAESASAALCMFFFTVSLEKRKRRTRQQTLPKTTARARNDGSLKSTQVAQDDVSRRPVSVFKNDSGSTGLAVLPNPTANETKVRGDLISAFLVGSCALPAWHVLPIFIDLKIAADPALPGLTQDTLPIATTAIFVGWLVSATMLDKALEIFDHKQLLVLHIIGLLMVVLATITLPFLSAGNLAVFILIRFIYGLLMNITAIQCIYVQKLLPKDQGNQAQVLLSIGYCVVAMLMAWSCSGLTLTMDWRLEALFWYGTPLLLALLIDFPESWKTALSLPVAVGKKLHVQKTPVPDIQRDDGKNLTFAENGNIVALAVAFLACGGGFFGLTYSAGQLSPDIYMSCMLLHGGDILGYLLALTADKYGRNNVQAFCFLAASICLMLCSTGEPGTPFVLSCAVVGRLCLDVCFTTIYVALAQVFVGRASKVALTTCETTARVGGTIAPMTGTWPTTVSCPLFASLCLAAACCTLTLPESAVQSKGDEKSPQQRE